MSPGLRRLLAAAIIPCLLADGIFADTSFSVESAPPTRSRSVISSEAFGSLLRGAVFTNPSNRKKFLQTVGDLETYEGTQQTSRRDLLRTAAGAVGAATLFGNRLQAHPGQPDELPLQMSPRFLQVIYGALQRSQTTVADLEKTSYWEGLKYSKQASATTVALVKEVIGQASSRSRALGADWSTISEADKKQILLWHTRLASELSTFQFQPDDVKFERFMYVMLPLLQEESAVAKTSFSTRLNAFYVSSYLSQAAHQLPSSAAGFAKILDLLMIEGARRSMRWSEPYLTQIRLSLRDESMHFGFVVSVEARDSQLAFNVYRRVPATEFLTFDFGPAGYISTAYYVALWESEPSQGFMFERLDGTVHVGIIEENASMNVPLVESIISGRTPAPRGEHAALRVEFAGLRTAAIQRQMRRSITIHEVIHGWRAKIKLVINKQWASYGARFDRELPAYLGTIALSDKPIYNFYQLIRFLDQGNEGTAESSVAQFAIPRLMRDASSAFPKSVSDRALVFVESDQPMTSQRALDWLALLLEVDEDANMTRNALRRAAQTVLSQSYMNPDGTAAQFPAELRLVDLSRFVRREMFEPFFALMGRVFLRPVSIPADEARPSPATLTAA